MSFSPADKQTLSFRAASLYERAAALEAWAPAEPALTAAAEQTLWAWNQAFAPGDPAAFARRLTWDGLDVSRAAALFSPDAATAMPVAPWTAWLDDVAEEAMGAGREAPAGGDEHASTSAGVPFPEIWLAWLRASRRALDRTVPARVFDAISPAVQSACDRQLLLELSRQGELALFEHFRAFLAGRNADGARDGYRAFVGRTLETGLAELAAVYPALARQLSSIASDWVASTREWLVRLVADRAAIAATFNDGVDPGAIARVELALSDPHHGRRRVHAVTFASGLRLVYKPRSVALERVFSELVAWLDRDLPAPLRALRVLDRESHGWVEFAAHEPLPDRGAVERYYRQAGALMCLSWVLRARDLHMENVVATAAGPVLVDLEMLLQPVSQSAARVTDAIGEIHASALVEESCLSTGLLSLIEITADGDAQDSGGLRGESRGRLPFARRVWKNLGTADLHYVDEPMYSAPGRHEVRQDAVAQRPDDYATHVVGGFADAYRSLLARRDELLSAGGPLRAFRHCATRVLPRPTNQYAMLLYVLAAPKYQADGAARSAAIDVLHRGFNAATARPDLWQVAVEERRALERLDVPYFSVRCDGTEATCEGRLVVRDYFARSGLDAAASRVRAMSADDLRIQQTLIARALGESIRSAFATPLDSAGDDAEPSEFLDAALWVARELLSRARREDERLTWPYRVSLDPGWSDHHLYDGTVGPATFFSALAAVTGDAAWREAARGAIAPVARHIRGGGLRQIPDAQNIGGLSGLGSLVYGLTLAGSLLEEPSFLDLARQTAATIGPRIAGDRCLDIVDGSAGAAMALLALADATGDPATLQLAADCGLHLVGHGVASGDGLAWPSADGQRLVGFAHGAAGVVHALAQLFAATGDERFRDAARRGCRFVNRQFLPAHGNFALADRSEAAPTTPQRVMTAWCHGAPGVALGLLSALDICEKAAILSGFDRAAQTTARADVIQPDHLCCGTLGRAEVLLTIGRRLGRADVEESGAALARDVLSRARRRRHFRLSGAGSEYRVFDPGFFRGISGIGYEMLRLVSPDRVPSVLALEAPRH